ncbi:MAG: chromosome segregation protein SMC [Desulfobacterales bacterium]|nr:MAG: chromosome segregation protein SMC [Desulfobacterales bacterium]
MKIKKLEITGFKSFYDKAAIEFPAGISAVVGPNGCGKSNVIDALRWVMGEQSVKQLRGKSTEDLIFAGTNGRPPLNMAEVSLTLANDNGNAPEELKDFTEIMLTRRLYRSGESAYFLNKQPCRLKDIHNVFLGSGLGAKSYAIIQQGNIGAITDAGPDERRVFIEEAAGIMRYKNRKIEALRKIQMTNQNLLRVQDIISEISRQMASLKRQARKAELYNKYQNHIKALDVVLSLYYYDDFTRQIDETAQLLQALKDADIGHSAELKKLDAAVEGIRLKRSQKNQEISNQKAVKFETQRDIDRTESDLAHLREESERLRQESAELEIAHAHLEEKNKEMVGELVQIEKDNHRLQQEIHQVKTHLAQEQSAAQNMSDQLARDSRELASSQKQLMDLVTQEVKYKNIFQNAANNKESLQRRLKRIDEEAALAAQRLSETRQKETDAQKQLESIRAQIVNITQQTETVRNQLQEKAQALGRQVKLVQSLDLERNTVKSKYAALKKMEDNFEWYKDGVRAIMKAQRPAGDRPGKDARDADQDAASSGDHRGLAAEVIGLMADIIEADPSLETAVEAVLGESLQYILVRNQEDGRAAIDYLQAHRAGRSGFIPVTAIKAVEGIPPNDVPSASRLLNHISVKPGFEEIARALLGHVVLTGDMREAITLFNRNGARQTLVTPNGDVLSPQGILIGGSPDKLSGILAKKHQIKELDNQNRTLEQKLDQARGEQSAMESVVRRLESELQQLIEQKNAVKEDETEAEKALYRASEDLKNVRRHLEIVNLEQEQLLGEASDIDDEMSKYNQVLADIAAEIQTVQNSVATLNAKVGQVSAAVEEFNQKAVDLKLKLTALNASLENSTHSLKRLQTFQADSLKRLAEITEEISLKHQKRKAAQQKIIDYEQKLAGMYQNMEQLERALESHEADYLAIDAQLKDRDSRISTIQGQREKTLEKLRLVELEQSHHQLKRENIASRLTEHYQKPVAALRAEYGRNSENFGIQPEMTVEAMESELVRYKDKLANIVDVNLGAIREYEQLKERFDFLEEQRSDLVQAIADLQKVIRKINKITQQRFIETFNLINEKLKEVFPRLFEGGTANLILTEPDKPLETGVEFMIHPPGKKLTRLSLLSGGEKALSAIAFIFSIFLIKPAAFCLLDEIDAPLDDVNVSRFNNLLQIIGENSQIIMITHNKHTMEFADTLFGITMEQKGVSKVVSVNFQRSGDLN